MKNTLDSITIHGGTPLKGEIAVRGAKNAIPKIMVASLLTDQPCTLRNVAAVEDVEVVTAMITAVGGAVSDDGKGTLTIENKTIKDASAAKLKKIAGKSRIPILFAGPLLHRVQSAHLPALGGCKIGPRPVDFHLLALEKMGATVHTSEKGFHLTADKLVGTKVTLAFPSVGATEQTLLAAVRAKGVTELINAALEPEIIDLIKVLQKMGAIIYVGVNRTITIHGVETLTGYDHHVLTDRIETASWACAAAATNGEIFIKNAEQGALMTFLNKFRQAGGMYSVESEGIRFWRGKELRSVSLETDVYPGFATDWQQPFTVMLTQAKGASIVHETVYESRFGYTTALNRMGADIQLFTECLGGETVCRFGRRNHLHSAVVVGPTKLHGEKIHVPNLRAGFSYVVAALAAEGKTTITNIGVIRRGYEQFSEKLKALGATIESS